MCSGRLVNLTISIIFAVLLENLIIKFVVDMMVQIVKVLYIVDQEHGCRFWINELLNKKLLEMKRLSLNTLKELAKRTVVLVSIYLLFFASKLIY